jgi:glutamate racemase
MGRDVVLVSSADETAFDVRERLLGSDVAAPAGRIPTHRFFSSGDPISFSAVGGRLFGPELARAETVPWA